MNALVRRFIKTAVMFLAIGLLTGTYLLVRRELFGIWPQSYEVSAHTHAVFVGFVMFMILFARYLLKSHKGAQDKTASH